MATESEVAQSAEALRAAQQSLAQSTSDLANKQSALSSATSAAYNSLKGFSNSMASGRAELQSLNQIYEVMGSAVGRTSRIIGELGSKIPLIGGLFSSIGKYGDQVAKNATSGIIFLNSQLQNTLKQFQAFGSIGALGAQGMSGLRDQMRQSGMTMEGFQQTVMANSQALAAFAGTTSEGAEKFSAIVGAITTDELGDQLRLIGMSADQIGDAAAGFMAQEQRLGRGQALRDQDAARTAQSAAAYAKELDTLARLTGQSSDAIRKQQDAILNESRYRAAIFDLDAVTQKRLRDAQSMFANTPQVAKGIRDLVSGVANTVESQQLLTLTGGAAQDAVDRLKAGAIDEFQFRKELAEKIRENAGAFANIAKFDDGINSAVGNFAEIADVAATNVDGIQSAVTAQNKLSAGTDGLTVSTVNAQKALENLSRVVTNIVSSLMPYAAQITQSTTGSMVSSINTFTSLSGLPKLNAQGQAESTAAPPPPTGSYATTPGGAVPGMVRPRPPAAAPAAPSSLSPRDLLQFEGTSLQDFQQLDSNMQASILSAAQDFYRDTGQRLRISSAFRNRAQQEALYANRLNNQYPVAPPGTSQHEKGFAVDIMNFQSAERYLNQQGLYRPNPQGDPIHFEPGRGDSNGVSYRGGYTPTLDGNMNLSTAGSSTNNQSSAADMTVFQEQLNKLDRIVQATERQAQLSQQYLSYAS